MSCRLSVIIPVFNVEHTLHRCLSSLPILDNIEVIVIDDGSTDNSAAIAKQYDFIQLIQQENRGLGAARNTGLAYAKGEWITFIDSDDYLAPGTLQALMKEADKCEADIIEYSYQRIGTNGKVYTTFVPRPKLYISVADYWNKTKAWRHTYAWNKLYRKEIFRHEKWSEGVRFEDASSLPRFLKHCSSIATTGTGTYLYCDNPKGLSFTASLEDTLSLLKAQWENFNQYPTPCFYADIVNIQITALQQGATEPLIPICDYYHTPKLIVLHLLGFKRLASYLHCIHSFCNCLKVKWN